MKKILFLILSICVFSLNAQMTVTPQGTIIATPSTTYATASDTATRKIATSWFTDSAYQKQPRSTNVASGINLTLPASLIDTTDFVHITQTVASTVYTLANLTSTKSRTICIVNKTGSTQSFTIGGIVLPIGQTIKFDWDGISWKQQFNLWSLNSGTLSNASATTITIDAANIFNVAPNTTTSIIGNTTNLLSTLSFKSSLATVFNFGTGGQLQLANDGKVGIGTATPTSTLDNVGSFGQRLTNTSLAAYTALATDNIIFLNLAGAQTLTLPAASTCLGRTYRIKNPTNFMKTVSTYTSNDGTAGFTHILEGEDFELISDGTVWRKIGGFNDMVHKSIYMATGAWNTKTIAIGGLEFIMNGASLGSGRVLQVRSTDGSTRNSTELCTRFLSGAYNSGEVLNIGIIPATYTSLHTVTTDIPSSYYKTVISITDRTNTTIGRENWTATIMDNGSNDLSVKIEYSKSR